MLACRASGLWRLCLVRVYVEGLAVGGGSRARGDPVGELFSVVDRENSRRLVWGVRPGPVRLAGEADCGPPVRAGPGEGDPATAVVPLRLLPLPVRVVIRLRRLLVARTGEISSLTAVRRGSRSWSLVWLAVVLGIIPRPAHHQLHHHALQHTKNGPRSW